MQYFCTPFIIFAKNNRKPIFKLNIMTKAINRYVWLINTLIQRRKLTFKEICELWDRSCLNDGKPLALRTFHQHREAIAELFGIEIVCDPDTYKYYLAEPDALKRDSAHRWLFNSFAIANTIEAGRSMKNRILFEDIPGGAEYTQTVVEAMQQGKVLFVDYKPFRREKMDLFLLPYAMRVYNRRWYIIGRFKDGEQIRTIALDRITRMRITDESFTVPEEFDVTDYYTHTVGIFVNDELKPQKVVLRTYGEAAEYMRSLPLHSSQREIFNDEGDYSDFEYYLNLSPELTGKILAQGAGVEVLEPQELRERIKEQSQAIADRYKKRGFWR